MDKEKTTYKLPAGWVWASIPDLYTIIGGGTPSKNNSHYWGGNINWASVKDIKSQFLVETIDKITNEGLENSSASIADIGDIILVTRMSPGQVAIVKQKTAVNQDLKILKSFGGVSPSFTYFLIKSQSHQFISNASGTTVKGLKISTLNKIRLPIPPLNEQNQIVSKIEELFSELDHAEKALQKAKHQLSVYRQALLKSAFEGKLTEKWRIENISDEFKPFGPKNHSFPLGWSISEIGKITEFIGSGSTPKGGRNVYQRNGIPFIRSQNIHVNSFIQDDLVFISEEVHEKMKRTQIKPKDVLLNITGASIGRCAFIPENFEMGNVNQHVCIIRVIHQRVNYKYLTYYLNSPENQLLINRINSGATREALNLTQIKHIKFPICSLSEQMQIVIELESRFSLIEYLEKTLIRSLKDITISRHVILKKAFDGKLVKQESTDESATLLMENIKKEKETYLLNMKTLEKKRPSKNTNMRSSLVEIILNNFNSKSFTIEELHSKTSLIYDEFRNQLFELLDNENLIPEFDKNKGQIFYKYQK